MSHSATDSIDRNVYIRTQSSNMERFSGFIRMESCPEKMQSNR